VGYDSQEGGNRHWRKPVGVRRTPPGGLFCANSNAATVRPGLTRWRSRLSTTLNRGFLFADVRIDPKPVADVGINTELAGCAASL
jgi:hypothetical protein